MDPESKTTLLAVLVQVAIQDIAFLKRQQVITATYVVAVHVGVIVIVTGGHASDHLVLILLALSLLAMVVGWVILCQLQKSIGTARGRLEEYDNEHFPMELKGFTERRPDEKLFTKFVFWVLLLSQLLSFIVVTCIVVSC